MQQTISSNKQSKAKHLISSTVSIHLKSATSVS